MSRKSIAGWAFANFVRPPVTMYTFRPRLPEAAGRAVFRRIGRRGVRVRERAGMIEPAAPSAAAS